jgi:hypothetical protein
MDIYCSGIPDRLTQGFLSLGSVVAARAVEQIASVALAAVEAMEAADRLMRID